MRGFHRLWKLSLALVVNVPVVSGCASDRAVIDQANQMHSGIEPAVMQDPELNTYLQSVGARIIHAAKKLDAKKDDAPESHRAADSQWMFSESMKFHFVNSETLNAFTTGGEHMYIYNALFQQCASEDELAAVMAHEYAHVYARHVHKGMNRQYTTLGLAAAAGAAGFAVGGSESGAEYGAGFAGAALVAGQFIGKGFTRKDEGEADQLGFDFYTRAGWNPDHFDDFFQHMIDKGYDTTPEMMSDHPTLASRVQASTAWAEALPASAKKWRQPPVADAAAFKRLQARAFTVGKTMPADKTLEGAKTLLAAFPSCVSAVEKPDQKKAREKIGAYQKQRGSR